MHAFIPKKNIYDKNIVRGGVGYILNPTATLWVGYDFRPSQKYRMNRFLLNQRLWQQLLWNPFHSMPISLISRTRLEQRFHANRPNIAWVLRQRIMLKLPQRVSPLLYDEIFLSYCQIWCLNT